MHRIRSLLVATAFLSTTLAVGAVAFPALTLASCSNNNFVFYVNVGGTGTGQSSCLESAGNISNFQNLSQPACPTETWNDCISSVRVGLDQLNCIRTYAAANYTSTMATYWGPQSNSNFYNVSPNDAMSSVKQYRKVPSTPAGNC